MILSKDRSTRSKQERECYSNIFRKREEEKLIRDILNQSEPLYITPGDEHIFQITTKCHICDQPFTDETIKIIDNDHPIIGRNICGVACQSCNVNYKYCNFVPVLFNNLQGLDSHLFRKTGVV